MKNLLFLFVLFALIPVTSKVQTMFERYQRAEQFLPKNIEKLAGMFRCSSMATWITT